jgi:hypothetical protein
MGINRGGAVATAALLAVFAAPSPSWAGRQVVPSADGQIGVQVDCSSQSVANNDDGYAIMWDTHNLKLAPYEDCGTVTSLSGGTKIWIWCWVENSWGNQWFWGRVDGTSTYGWMSVSNVENHMIPAINNGWCPGEPNQYN